MGTQMPVEPRGIDADTEAFCTMIKNRSKENHQAMQCLFHLQRVISPAFSILRQELDSMIRVIFLLDISDLVERKRLIKCTLNGEKWKKRTKKGKWAEIRDREMVDIAGRLQGWTQSVYRFGCAFVHLSNFHNHLAENPFQSLSDVEKENILTHMRAYHGGPAGDDPDMAEISEYLPRIFDKISSNLGYYLRELEQDRTLVD
jgi:hypothetical protein